MNIKKKQTKISSLEASKKSRKKSYETIQKEEDSEKWALKLYVAGQTDKSMTAFANLHIICEQHLKGKYRIEIIDLLKNPTLAKGDKIFAIPTLVRKLPVPIRRIIGDLSNTERVLVGLDLLSTSTKKKP